MKKNLILLIGLILVLVMIVSVSALPSWMTGKATGTDSVDIKVNKGETKGFSLGGETHEISVLFMDGDSVVVLSVDGANTGGMIKGATYESGTLKVKVLTIRYFNNWFSKSKYVTLEVSKVESCEGDCTQRPVGSSYRCNADKTYNGDEGDFYCKCNGPCQVEFIRIEPATTPTTINEGETIIASGHEISINWMDNDEVVFMVDGERVPASGKLREGDSAKLSDGSYIKVDDIAKLEITGEVGSVRFTITTTGTPTTCTDSDNGLNPYVKGTTIYFDNVVGTEHFVNFTDRCEGRYLVDSYCRDGPFGLGFQQMLECSDGCEEGVCLNKPKRSDCKGDICTIYSNQGGVKSVQYINSKNNYTDVSINLLYSDSNEVTLWIYPIRKENSPSKTNVTNITI